MSLTMSGKFGVSSISLFLASIVLGLVMKLAMPKKVMRDCPKDANCSHNRQRIALAQDALFIFSLLLLGAAVITQQGASTMSTSSSVLLGFVLLFIVALQYKVNLPFSSAPLIQSGSQPAHWMVGVSSASSVQSPVQPPAIIAMPPPQ